MSQVAMPSSVPPSSHRIASGHLKGGSMVKRKTPSELRGEQLMRTSVVDFTNESPPAFVGSTNATEVDNGFKKPGLFRAPRSTGTRLDEVCAAKKSRFRIVSGKENAKENPSLEQASNRKNLSAFSTLEAKTQQGTSWFVSCIPQDMGYSKLAHLAPQYGLYSSFVPPLIYAFMGSSRDIAIGPMAVVSLLLGTLLSNEIDPVTYFV